MSLCATQVQGSNGDEPLLAVRHIRGSGPDRAHTRRPAPHDHLDAVARSSCAQHCLHAGYSSRIPL